MDDVLLHAAELIRRSHSLVVTAGAGMGVDSGLPDFRSSNGFWRAYPALGKLGIDFQEIASPVHFDRAPRLAWGFYGHRLRLYRNTVPHHGYALLHRWCKSVGDNYTVFTSNVDGHFVNAGFEADHVHECHGSIHYLQCTAPCSNAIWPADELDLHVDEATCQWQGELPRCPRCGAVARPNILMFNDSDWIEHRSRRQAESQESLLETFKSPVIIEIGAGTAIKTVRRFSEQLVRQRNAHLIRINPDATAHDSVDVTLAMPALHALSCIASLL